MKLVLQLNKYYAACISNVKQMSVPLFPPAASPGNKVVDMSKCHEEWSPIKKIKDEEWFRVSIFSRSCRYFLCLIFFVIYTYEYGGII